MTAIPDLIRQVHDREILDDDLVECLIVNGERVLEYVTSSSAAELLDPAHPAKLDALRGCLLVISGAAKEVSEPLRNWRADVPWDDLADLASWRLHGPTTSLALLESLCAFIRNDFPAALEVVREFRAPHTR